MSQFLFNKITKEITLIENTQLNTNGLSKLKTLIEDYDRMVSREMNMEKKARATEKLNEFKQFYQKQQSVLVAQTSERQSQQNAIQTASANELFQRNKQTLNESEYFLKESSRLDAVDIQMDGFISQGQSTLNDLREQGSLLGNTQQKIFNTLNSMDLTRNVMRMIERRSSTDKLILIGGMCGTLFCIFCIFYYFQ